MFEAASGNDSVNSVNVFFFSIRHIKLCIPDITLSAKDNQKLSKLPSKWYERWIIGINTKQTRVISYNPARLMSSIKKWE